MTPLPLIILPFSLLLTPFTTDLGYTTAVAYTPKESKQEGEGGGDTMGRAAWRAACRGNHTPRRPNATNAPPIRRVTRMRTKRTMRTVTASWTIMRRVGSTARAAGQRSTGLRPPPNVQCTPHVPLRSLPRVLFTSFALHLAVFVCVRLESTAVLVQLMSSEGFVPQFKSLGSRVYYSPLRASPPRSLPTTHQGHIAPVPA